MRIKIALVLLLISAAGIWPAAAGERQGRLEATPKSDNEQLQQQIEDTRLAIRKLEDKLYDQLDKAIRALADADGGCGDGCDDARRN